MSTDKRITAFAQLGTDISSVISNFESIDETNDDFSAQLKRSILSSIHKNAWFTPENIISSLSGIASWLNVKDLTDWVSGYDIQEDKSPKTVALIMAGNIPLVGFHDMLSVLISGNIMMAKPSSDDNVLPQLLMKRLCQIEPTFADRIIFTERISSPGAVIATGSDNSARYFEYYFGKYPNIIRKNRNSIAVLSGDETKEELSLLGKDIFMYFGLGCRNISKLYVPQGYNFDGLFEAMADHSELMQHNKYSSNHDYYSALLLLKRVPFLTNNYLIIKEAEEMATPVSIVNYEYYSDKTSLINKMETQMDQIQCIVADRSVVPGAISFGETQKPGLADYADGVDTMKFLVSLA